MNGCDYVSQDRLEALDHIKSGPEHTIVEIYPINDEVRCKMMEEAESDEEES